MVLPHFCRGRWLPLRSFARPGRGWPSRPGAEAAGSRNGGRVGPGGAGTGLLSGRCGRCCKSIVSSAIQRPSTRAIWTWSDSRLSKMLAGTSKTAWPGDVGKAPDAPRRRAPQPGDDEPQAVGRLDRFTAGERDSGPRWRSGARDREAAEQPTVQFHDSRSDGAGPGTNA